MAPTSWIDLIRSPHRREDAQTLAEYAVILGVITPAVILAFAAFGGALAPLFDTVRGFL